MSLRLNLALAAWILAVAASSVTTAADVIITEVDYNQPGTDSFEWIEIHNTLDVMVPTDSLFLVLCNGAIGTGCFEYDRINLKVLGGIPEHAYIVLGQHASAILPLSLTTNSIQNGAPDVILLEYLGEVIDSVEYASDLTNTTCELTLTAAADSESVGGSIHLCDGEWQFSTTSTPSAPNDCD